MMLRVVSSRGEIEELNRNEQIVHLAFRASNTDIFKLLQNCPRLRVIQVPASYRRTLSRASEMFLVMQGIELIEGDVWGHRKDINDYYIIDERIFDRINQMRASGRDADDIVFTVSREMKISPELARYVIRQNS